MIQMTGAPTGLIVTAAFATRSSSAVVSRRTSGIPACPRRSRSRGAASGWRCPERLTAEGTVDRPLDEDAVRKAAATAAGVRRARRSPCASCTPTSTRRTSCAPARSCSRSIPTSSWSRCPTRCPPKPPEFERTSTTLVNGYVGPPIARYLERLQPPSCRQRATPSSCSSRRPPVASRHRGRRRPPRRRDHRVGADGRCRAAARAAHEGRPRRRGERRHGWHELRRLPHPRRQARHQDGLELVPPLLHRASDDRHSVDRRRRRVDRGERAASCTSVRSRRGANRVRSATGAAAPSHRHRRGPGARPSRPEGVQGRSRSISR